jgi:DNA-binding NarL/FixJ family response regulator
VPERWIATVAIGRLTPLVSDGVAHVLGADPGPEVLASDLDPDELESLVAQPTVMIVGDAEEHALLMRLKSRRPATGLLVLADDPSNLLGTTLLADGVTCVAQTTATVALRAAVHLTAQGDSVFVGIDGQRVQRPSRDRLRSLTGRETQVLKQIRRRGSPLPRLRWRWGSASRRSVLTRAPSAESSKQGPDVTSSACRSQTARSLGRRDGC